MVAAAVVFAGSKNCYTRHVYPVDSRTGRLHGSLVTAIPRSDRVSTENGWKSVLLENVNCVNLNHFRLKRLIPIEQDLSMCSLIAQSPQRLITINETLNTNTTIRENPVEVELDITSSNSNHRFSKPVS